jgi:hypothetical protein
MAAQNEKYLRSRTTTTSTTTNMSHAPKNPGYFDTIQFYFLEVTGTGFMFSGRDLELLSRWRDEGATATVICRGIKEAVASMDDDDDPPRGIWPCQGWIESEIERAREMATGGHAHREANQHEASPGETKEESRAEPSADAESSAYADLFEEALANIERGGKTCEAEALREVYRKAWKELKVLVAGAGVDDPFAELAAIEDALVDGYFRALDRHVQNRIEDAISEQNRADLAIMSPEAREEHLTARRRKLLVREYGLTTLV